MGCIFSIDTLIPSDTLYASGSEIKRTLERKDAFAVRDETRGAARSQLP
jgi:hypothetical protein